MDERAARKKALIAIGAAHRAELLLSRAALREAARPQAMARSLVQVAVQRFTGDRGPEAGAASGPDIAGIVPLLANGLSTGGGRGGILKLLVGSGALTGAAAAALAYLRRKKGAPPGDGQL